MGTRVAIYTRISADLEGLGLGVARQEVDCRKVCQDSGWEVAGVYVDNYVSAFKRKVIRPEWERLLGDLGTGAVDGLVVYDLDRLARQPIDLERLIRIYEDRPSLVFANVNGLLNLRTSEGKTTARIQIAMANKSSEDTARRVARKHLESAQAGIPVGGTRPFGWRPDRRTLDPEEAALIRQAVQDIIGGVGVHTITRQWIERGVLSPAGMPWNRASLRRMLLSPRLAGYRVHRGEIATDPAGNPVRGQYEAVLDEATWRQVVAVLTTDKGFVPHIGGRKYLLAGLVRCALCGSVMNGNAAPNGHSYRCEPPTRGGCGKVSVNGPALDKMITDAVLTRMAQDDEEPDPEPWEREDELADLRERLAEVMKQYRQRDISIGVAFGLMKDLEADIKALEAEHRAHEREQARRAAPVTVPEDWPALDMERRRAVVERYVQAVLIRPPTRRGPRFDPDRVDVVPR